MKKELIHPLTELEYLNNSHQYSPAENLKTITIDDFSDLRNTKEYRTTVGDSEKPFSIITKDLFKTNLQIANVQLSTLAAYNTSVALALCEDRIRLLRNNDSEIFKDRYNVIAIEAARVMQHISGKPQLIPPLLPYLYKLFSQEYLNAEYILRLPGIPYGMYGPALYFDQGYDKFARAITKAAGENISRSPLLWTTLRPLELIDIIDESEGGEKHE